MTSKCGKNKKVAHEAQPSVSLIYHNISCHNISYHTYADDTQLYLSFRAQDYACMVDAKSSMELCVNDIKMWMQSHFLKLNDDKTELLLVHSKYRQMPLLLPVVVGNEMIMPTECARNIGVMFDHNLTIDQQITSICKSEFFSHK